MTEDEKYMARCIQLARCGQNHAAPNPMVGAVIVADGRIIGEGYHIRCGEAHAEVNAVRSVHPEDEKFLKQSTIYVSLEPCSHYGKTPPCADLIIACGIPRVVVGCVDPFSEVSGRGIRKLRDAGINVTVGVLEKECLALNRRFIINHTEKRPYVILKWAQSSDGFIDRHRSSSDEPPVVFSNAHTSMLVHRQRAGVQAIMVGRRTALLDNPSLACGARSRTLLARDTPPFRWHSADVGFYGSHQLSPSGRCRVCHLGFRPTSHPSSFDRTLCTPHSIYLSRGRKYPYPRLHPGSGLG